MLTEQVLDLLGDYFVEQQMKSRGWEFHEFVTEWQRGFIVIQPTQQK